MKLKPAGTFPCVQILYNSKIITFLKSFIKNDWNSTNFCFIFGNDSLIYCKLMKENSCDVNV